MFHGKGVTEPGLLYDGWSQLPSHLAFAPAWFGESGRYSEATAGWTLWRGSGMLNSVAVVNDTTTSTLNVSGIHVASRQITILEADASGVMQGHFMLETSGQAPAGHDAHFKALTGIRRSMLALTTCAAVTAKPGYTCAGTGINKDGMSSINTGSYDGGDSLITPDYLTSKIWARYPKLLRSEFVVDCNAATVEICNKVEERCQPFLCTQ